MALAIYGVPIAGGIVGSQVWGGWLGAGVGLLLALALSALILGAAMPLLAVVRRRGS
jgi:hypothetical protein